MIFISILMEIPMGKFTFIILQFLVERNKVDLSIQNCEVVCIVNEIEGRQVACNICRHHVMSQIRCFTIFHLFSAITFIQPEGDEECKVFPT